MWERAYKDVVVLGLDEYTEIFFEEYERYETRKALFARAMDKLEPMIHQLDYKSEWKHYGYTEEVLREKKRKYMEPFPEVLKFYDRMIQYLKENEYI